ncbi:Zn-dependent protease (includes SpoIVFB) [Caldanaerobius fijiensis DSM 17918]|uniref:Zn-dependent protease (Includes SpoIVFB) n=2 Tax=Caldanaerobius TaxID=862261 RepID=A0A1M4UBP7_9THEO|nr:Zn-dependent protease (includes SpoIVFB) [Caldanaerobius fijiensis DSM 17918]
MDILIYLYRIPALLLAMSFHEYAHAVVSYKLGDPTPKAQGRLTLNPLAHIDPVGFLTLWIIGFGWAKPVAINPMYYKDVKKGEFLTAIAGPLSNVLMAFVSLLIIYAGGYELVVIGPILHQLYIYNIVLAVFNIIPVPPLDGSKILYSLLPYRYSYVLEQYENFGQILLLILLFTGIISRVMGPLVNLVDFGLRSIISIV